MVQSINGSNFRDAEHVRKFLSDVATRFNQKPFKAHALFRGPHAQTLAAYAWPRRRRLRSTVSTDEDRLFQVDEHVQVLAQCRWQQNKQDQPTIVIWHGMEGSTSSVYMWSTAAKAFEAGFNVIRVNYRSCGGPERLSPTLYHGGMSCDLKVVINELITKDKIKRIYPIGFSLGGNMVLKLLGEYGDHPPLEIVSACVVSPSVDLRASTELILKGSNWVYHRNFVRSMKSRVGSRIRLFPELYDATKLKRVNSIRDFDELFTSVSNGFVDANDYYQQASSIRIVQQIRIPTLIIHAVDDPFIPFEPLGRKSFTENPYLLLIRTTQGGHVAFISEANKTEDRFWAENRAVEFCKISETQLSSYF